ncbi:MAG: monovalent cation/H+ antiporter subunit D family protein [Desulfuromonadales bacterium]|nr:monovalent cation/H+ antiporter subunit D family protein [Desulfuromonadales bacterium]
MSGGGWLLILILASSLVPGVIIFFLREDRLRLRSALNMAGASAKLGLVIYLLLEVREGWVYKARFTLLPGMELVLHADAMSLLFATLSSGLWFVTTLYAIGYLEGSPNRRRFFGFFSLCVTATTGIALAGNMITFLIFYEILTLVTFPLVVHRGTEESLRAGRSYLAYTLSGGLLLLVGVAWLWSLFGPLEFVAGGVLAGIDHPNRGVMQGAFFLLIAGLGVKAALVPLHGWLPQAMVAPAPVSALLHAVAVVKAGAFGIVRVIYDLFGIEYAQSLGVLFPLALLASFTIIYGSLRALSQDDLKRRLAFSTISQISYITLGAAAFGPVATIGGLVHLVHQGLMKITLFFCAGNLAETLGIHRISEMNGVGQRLPWTMGAFTVGALGMIGLPPLVGFISKWYLGYGGLLAGHPWILLVLILSTLLNAAYFLPILHRAWFRLPDGPWPKDHGRRRGLETAWMLLLPPLLTAFLVIVLGLFANAPMSALEWVRLIAEREYGR